MTFKKKPEPFNHPKVEKEPDVIKLEDLAPEKPKPFEPDPNELPQQAMARILRDYDNKESDIPVTHIYWHYRNQVVNRGDS